MTKSTLTIAPRRPALLAGFDNQLEIIQMLYYQVH